MEIINLTNNNKTRLVTYSDFFWLCEVMENYPINGGSSMQICQDLISAMRKSRKLSRGVGVVLEAAGTPVAFACMARPNRKDDFAQITIQATHPDHKNLGYGRELAEVLGFMGFYLEGLNEIKYAIRPENVATSSLVSKFESISSSPTARPSRHEPDVIVEERVISVQNYLNYLNNNNIDLQAKYSFSL